MRPFPVTPGSLSSPLEEDSQTLQLSADQRRGGGQEHAAQPICRMERFCQPTQLPSPSAHVSPRRGGVPLSPGFCGTQRPWDGHAGSVLQQAALPNHTAAGPVHTAEPGPAQTLGLSAWFTTIQVALVTDEKTALSF